MESLLEKPASPKLDEYYNIIRNTFAFSPFCSICKKHPICWTLASVERQRPGCCERKSLFPGASGWLTLQRCMPVNAQTVICIYREKHIFTKTKFFFGIISYSQKIYLSFNVLKKKAISLRCKLLGGQPVTYTIFVVDVDVGVDVDVDVQLTNL